MKFKSVITHVDFEFDEVRFALADYVDFYHNKPGLAEKIRENKFEVDHKEKDKFPWPRNNAEVEEISHEKLIMLLKGIDFFNAHKKINFLHVS